jgi:hypothetical protein
MTSAKIVHSKSKLEHTYALKLMQSEGWLGVASSCIDWFCESDKSSIVLLAVDEDHVENYTAGSK